MDKESPIPAAKAALDAPSDQSLRVPCYCEENVWRLAYRKLHSQQEQHPTGDGPSRHCQCYVVFITNPSKCVPMFHQMAASNPSRPCYWDYHVILISCGKKREEDDEIVVVQVFDMDSHLPFPCSLEEYLTRVFPTEIPWPPEYLPYFRVVPAKIFLQVFSSDRMHMYNAVTKKWSAPPPTYACILPSPSNLVKYMTIDENDVQSRKGTTIEIGEDPFGTILSLVELKQLFGINSTTLQDK